MNQATVRKSVEALLADGKKRKFPQTVDLIINLKDVNLKDPKQQVEIFHHLPRGRGKNIDICALVGPELAADAKKAFAKVITAEQFPGFSKKAEIKKLSNQYEFFVAQANLMAQVAQTFGRVLGPRGKMPNPKAGCVVPPKGVNLDQVNQSLQTTIKVQAKTDPVIHCAVGVETQSVDDLTENATSVINAVLHRLPSEQHNIKSIYLKKTMSAPVQVN